MGILIFAKAVLSLYATGLNDHGKLGINSTAADNIGFAVFDGNFEEIALGSSHALGRNKTGVYGWGSNEDLQLAHKKEQTSIPYPVPISLLTNLKIVGIAGGAAHTLALLENGSAVAFGSNRNGQLGSRLPLPIHMITLPNETISRVFAYGDASLFLTRSGRLYISGLCSQYICIPEVPGSGQQVFYEPTPLHNVPALSSMVMGHSYILGVPLESESPSELLVWGRNDVGQLCIAPEKSGSQDIRGVLFVAEPTKIDLGSPVRKMAASGRISVFKSDNKALWCGNGSEKVVNQVAYRDLLDVDASQNGVILLRTGKLLINGVDTVGELGFGRNMAVVNRTLSLLGGRRVVSQEDFTIVYSMDVSYERAHKKMATTVIICTTLCGLVAGGLLLWLCLWHPREEEPATQREDLPMYVDPQ